MIGFGHELPDPSGPPASPPWWRRGRRLRSCFPRAASAHALVGRKDLPVPAWLFAWGASLVLIISFALLSVAWTQARLQREKWTPLPRWLS